MPHRNNKSIDRIVRVNVPELDAIFLGDLPRVRPRISN